MRFLLRPGCASILAVLAATVPAHAGLILGTNWVVNGDAESAAGSADGSVVAVPNWVSFNGSTMFTAVQYASSPGSFPAFSDPGPASRGANFFAGGPNDLNAEGVQTLDVSGFAGQIDAGLLSFTLSGYLGGFQNQDDFARWTVTFFSDPNTIVGQDTVSGPFAADRSNQTGLLFETNSGTIPVGTRLLFFEVSMGREEGTYDDGYADNLSFVANSTVSTAPAPEVSSVALAAGGFLVLAGVARRRGRRT